MTKVITRYFDSAETAHTVRKDLLFIHRFSPKIVDLLDDADTAAATLSASGVMDATAEAYKSRLANGGAVLLVRAGYKPLCVAQTTREVTAEMGAADLGDLVEEVELDDGEDYSLSVLHDHPLMLSRHRDPDSTNYYMANWPIPLISRRKPYTGSLIQPNAYMANWPFGHISKRKPFTGSIIAPHAHMANFPIPLISRRKPRDAFAFPRHARMANFPIGLISKRKPFTGTWIGRHTRMANWPFPLLINGKSTNSLIPGAPRMANFPIPLLSSRKPYTGSIFSPHARMANFPIGLISKRKPFTGSIFSRHARMADFILPLVVKRFTLSGLFGIPTLAKR